MPPVSGGGSFGWSGESVLIEPKAEVIVFERVGRGGEKIPDIGFALLEFFEEWREPAWELAALGGEGGKPHLPVESGLERGDFGWESFGRPALSEKRMGCQSSPLELRSRVSSGRRVVITAKSP